MLNDLTANREDDFSNLLFSGVQLFPWYLTDILHVFMELLGHIYIYMLICYIFDSCYFSLIVCIFGILSTFQIPYGF
jgi:hypothetical protein